MSEMRPWFAYDNQELPSRLEFHGEEVPLMADEVNWCVFHYWDGRQYDMSLNYTIKPTKEIRYYIMSPVPSHGLIKGRDPMRAEFK